MTSVRHVFRISQKEIKRRKKALVTMLSSLSLGFFLATLNLKDVDLSSALILLVTLLSMIVLIGTPTFISFISSSKIKITIDNQDIERYSDKTKEKYPIKDIRKISIKRTKDGRIRELKITQDNGRYFFINGLKKFEKFYQILSKRIDTDIETKVRTEPINFDHKFFYLLLGLLVGLCVPLLLSAVNNFDFDALRRFSYSVAVLSIVTGLFFMSGRPISKRYGIQKRWIDLWFGLAAIMIGSYVIPIWNT